jgi:hypothetical protein
VARAAGDTEEAASAEAVAVDTKVAVLVGVFQAVVLEGVVVELVSEADHLAAIGEVTTISVF